MKSFILMAVLSIGSLAVFSQKLDKAKDLLAKNKLVEAKTEIDNFLSNEKNQANSDAWFLKTKIYTALSNDSTLKISGARDTAYLSLVRYMEIESQVKDTTKRYVQLTLDRKPLAEIYAGYSKDAASYYNSGNFNDAFTNFKKTLEVFDFMVKNKLATNMVMDTTTTLYAGIAAEKASKLDDAAIYYGKIAESKATGQGYESIYKWLADHYKQKNDLEKAAKYANLGKEVYPKDPFWLGFEIDMLSEKGTKEQLLAKYDEVTKQDPGNHLLWFNYAVELYKAGYDVDSTKRPANSKDMVDQAIEKANKSVELKTDFPNSHMLLGQIFYNQGVDISTKNKTIRPPQGGKLKPEQLKMKEDLRGEMNKKFDAAISHFEKVDELLGGQGKLKMEDKQFLKNSYDLLITIYEQKANKDKAAQYTEKFNNVDKVH